MTATTSPQAKIGVDVGGTHTDVQVVFGDISARGKSLTTYDDFSRGVTDAIAQAASAMGYSLRELLTETEIVVAGTTVVTNVLTELRGTRVGVLVTAGFKDTFRFAGGPKTEVLDEALQTNMPDLVERRAIREVEGRIDHTAAELVPLNLEQLDREITCLVEEVGVETLAVCFLWSFLDPAHELAAQARIQARYPNIFVSMSHRVQRTIGENRRWTTAVMNSFVQAPAKIFLDTVSGRLKQSGLTGKVAFCQGIGGAISKAQAEQYPLSLLGSGPAGGAIGANALARRLGVEDVLIADMGGTSLDTGIIKSNTLHLEKNLALGRFKTGISVLDILSIGAGGGSIAAVSERGVPQVGPHSAKSTPGPACYGKGGEAPTVTDAMVALGVLDPDNYLGGRIQLDAAAARAALVSRFGGRFGWTPEQSALAVHDLVVANMANAIREVTVKKGYDPRQFLFLAYGGTLPMFACQIAATLGIGEVVVPQNSSVFCAQGLLSADFAMRKVRSLRWDLSRLEGLAQVNDVAAELIREVMAEMAQEGFEEEILISCEGDFRFVGQTDDLAVTMPSHALMATDIGVLQDRFLATYERQYGAGTPWRNAPVQLTTLTVTATAPGVRFSPPQQPLVPMPAAAVEKQRRPVYLTQAREWVELAVYDGGRFTPGTQVMGPCIIDETDTTIFVPPHISAMRDVYMNYRLRRSVGA